MLRKVRLKRFKSWAEADWQLAPVTGLFGTNSSGKSSLLQFLLLLKQTKNSTDRGLSLDFGGPEGFVNLGSFSDIVHRHKSEQQIEWRLEWDLPESLRIVDPSARRTSTLFEGAEMAQEAVVGLRRETPRTMSIAYEFAGARFSLRPKSEGASEYRLEPSKPLPNGFRFVRTQGRAWAVPGPVKTHLFPDQAKTYYQNADLLSEFEIAYESLIDQIYYLGPLREYPKREYMWAGASPTDVGRRGERAIDAVLSAQSNGEERSLGWKKRRRSFEAIIAYWLKKIGLIDSFRVKEIAKGSNLYRVLVKRDSHSPEALLTDVGFGVSQVLPALVLLYYVPEGATVIMEQPEIHLHPSVQAGLADVIVNVAQVRHLQVIVESHSEHLLRRFQRRVAEEEIETGDIQLYFCDVEDGASQLIELELDVFGNIANWPEGFFGDEFGEIAAIRKAGLERRRGAAE